MAIMNVPRDLIPPKIRLQRLGPVNRDSFGRGITLIKMFSLSAEGRRVFGPFTYYTSGRTPYMYMHPDPSLTLKNETEEVNANLMIKTDTAIW